MKTKKLNLYFLLVTASLISFTALAEFKLTMPIECNYGENCFIQNYVDMNSEDGYKDYKCGFLTYDTHKGTDFRLIDYVQIKDGVKVLAAAEGTVTGMRNNVDDFDFLNNGKEAIAEKECGNGVVITHKNGYVTQYCHMLKGSIKVKINDQVSKSQVLGFVGMSGESQFPHLHISVKKDGKILDPFTSFSPEKDFQCNDTKTPVSMWDESTTAKLKYIDTAILNLHATTQIPQKFNARAGQYREDEIPVDATKVILWADIMGVNKDDVISFELKNSADNRVIFRNGQKVNTKYVLFFVYSGSKLRNKNLEKGLYNAKVTIFRKKQPVLSKEKVIKVIDSKNTGKV